jgi:hypothetical protein
MEEGEAPDTERLLTMRRMLHYLRREAQEVQLREAATLLEAAEAIVAAALRSEVRVISSVPRPPARR